MSVLHVTSPHVRRPIDTSGFMRQVIYATLPGVAVLTVFFGWGTFINIVLASTFAITTEAFIMKLRKRSVLFAISDYSAILTAVLLAIALPPSAPWWLTLIGVSFAIIVAKHLYGGLGSNPFNPAMIGYVLLLISFPLEMTAWLPALGTEGSQLNTLDFMASLSLIFSGHIGTESIDAFTMATPLDTFKTYAGNDLDKLLVAPVLQGKLAGIGWEWVNVAFLAGGLYLIAKRIITWHIPVAMLLGLWLISGFFHTAVDNEVYASSTFHLLSGGTMLGAFFIATDPVTAATSNKGKLIFGFCAGILIYVIRAWGGYPDAVAFSVLIMNLSAPTIDYYTQPRTYGHTKSKSGYVKHR